MNLKFLPYKFEPCLNNYKRELLFLGLTYYERYLVFEHLNKCIQSILGFIIERIELAFELETLVAVWLFVNESRIPEVLNVLQSYYNRNPNKVNLENYAEPINNIQYYWTDSNSEYLTGLGIKQHHSSVYIYTTLKRCNLYFTV